MLKVSEKIPFTFQQLQKYEKGANTISAYKLDKLADIYNVNLNGIVKPEFILNHQKSLTPPYNNKGATDENN